MGGEESPSLKCPKCGSGNVVGYRGVWECMDCGYKFRPKLESISRRYAVQERTQPTIQKSRSLKHVFALVLAFIIVFSSGLILGYGAGLSNAYTKIITVTRTVTKSYTIPRTFTASPSKPASQSSISQPTSEVITLREIRVHVEPRLIDCVGVYYSLKVCNNVNKSITYQAILKVNGKELVCTGIAGPYEEDVCSIQSYDAIYLDRPIGVRESQGELLIINSSERSELFMKRELKIRVPTVKFGEIIPPGKLNSLVFATDFKDIQVKMISWFESKKACEGPFVDDDYYIFNASKRMKFIILILNFTNTGKRIISTPYISEGEIGTNTGNIYPLWHYPPPSINQKHASPEELEKICPIYEKEKLLQGESSIEYLVFEIKEDEKPVEAFLPGIPYIIVFQD